MIKQLNKNDRAALGKIHKEETYKIVKRNKLYEGGKRLSCCEAFLTMFSVAIGIGYV